MPGQGDLQAPLSATLSTSWADWKLRPANNQELVCLLPSFPLFRTLTLSPDQSAGRLLQVTEALVSLPVSPAHRSYQTSSHYSPLKSCPCSPLT